MTAPTHAWLRRLSDYHGGGLGEAERIAVEEHLVTCAECQEALSMYRRFYTLLHSPLRLGGPSVRFDESTIPIATIPRQPTPPGPRRPRPRNRRALAGIAAALAAALIIAGFVAVIGSRLRAPTVGGTPSPQVSPSAQPSPTGTAAPAPSGFVCANPQGSSMTYAYVLSSDELLYVVTGCDAPRHFGLAQTAPLAWSPSNRYLAATSDSPDAKVEIIDVQSGAISQTQYAVSFGQSPQVGDTPRIFFGWLDESSFLGGITTITNNPQHFEQPGPTTLVRVDVGSGRETMLGSIPGWVNSSAVRVVANGRSLFYAGYDSAATTAYLHRFDLAAGTDTQLVSLGLYVGNGCQNVLAVCGWTTPWAVSPDGAHILYHHPGAASAPNQIYAPADTPVLYANPDGSGASMPFGSLLASSIVTPIFSPDGSAAEASGDFTSTGSAGAPPMKVVRFGGTPALVSGTFGTWRGDSAALVLDGFFNNNVPRLYDLASGKATPLEAGSFDYLWAH